MRGTATRRYPSPPNRPTPGTNPTASSIFHTM
jgi:hypothetical protein